MSPTHLEGGKDVPVHTIQAYGQSLLHLLRGPQLIFGTQLVKRILGPYELALRIQWMDTWIRQKDYSQSSICCLHMTSDLTANKKRSTHLALIQQDPNGCREVCL